MKRIGLITALILLVSVVAQSQLYRVEQNIFTNKQFRCSAKDSTQSLPIVYDGNGTIEAIRGSYPDSIRIEWSVSKDSIYSIDLWIETKNVTQSAYVRTKLDTIGSATELAHTGGFTVPQAVYKGQDKLGLLAIARASVNAVNTVGSSYFTIKYARYFRKN